jgi:hypothetical protein
MKKVFAALALTAALSIAATSCAIPEEDGGTTAADRAEVNTKDKKPGKKKNDAPKETAGQQNARESAESYLDLSAFSRQGLIKQLKYEGYSEKDAAYGVDAQKANWNKQAAASAQNYLDMSSFSRDGLIQQLVYEGFTRTQAEYGVKQVGL